MTFIGGLGVSCCAIKKQKKQNKNKQKKPVNIQLVMRLWLMSISYHLYVINTLKICFHEGKTGIPLHGKDF